MPKENLVVTHASDKPSEPEYVPIEVTAGILIHIGAGIYHSVAGALKELVSNAYDADAPNVVITTNYPTFEQIKIVDTGDGMTPLRFRQAMRSVGSSLKGILEPSRTTKVYRRPVIGQLGIGFMALSQICDEATIESQAKGSDKKFIAKLNFREFKERAKDQVGSVKLDVYRETLGRYGSESRMRHLLKDKKIDAEEKDKIRDFLALLEEAGDTLKKEDDTDREHLGYSLLYPDIPAIPGGHGTTITLDAISDAVRELLQDHGREVRTIRKYYKKASLTWESYRGEINEWSWSELCQRLRAKTSGLTFQLLPKYHQFLYELSLMTPVKYLDDGPLTLRPGLLEKKKRQLKELDFSVTVDSRELFKPTLLPAGALAKKDDLRPRLDYYLKPFQYAGVVDKQQLKYSGYLFWQKSQIQPSHIRGIQIYIRNVGIGLYDNTLMNFATVNPTSRAGQISGEVYVQAGLEHALNVNRNSFRETDAHYLALQQHLWKILGTTKKNDGVIGISVQAYWDRKKHINAEKLRTHIKRLQSIVDSVSKRKLVVSFSSRESSELYEVVSGRLIVYDQSRAWPRRLQDRRLCQQLLIPAKAAVVSQNSSSEILKLLEHLLLTPK
jgi:hypothetical protein